MTDFSRWVSWVRSLVGRMPSGMRLRIHPCGTERKEGRRWYESGTSVLGLWKETYLAPRLILSKKVNDGMSIVGAELEIHFGDVEMSALLQHSLKLGIGGFHYLLLVLLEVYSLLRAPLPVFVPVFYPSLLFGFLSVVVLHYTLPRSGSPGQDSPRTDRTGVYEGADEIFGNIIIGGMHFPKRSMFDMIGPNMRPS